MGIDEETQEKVEKSHNIFKDSHEADAKVIKADNKKWDNDWDTINAKREEIKAIKEKKRMSKLNQEIDEETQEKIEKSHNIFKDSHEKQAKVIKADNKKWDNDWDKIEKQRAEIKAIKLKQRIAKLEAEENGVMSPIIDEETQE